VSESRPSCGCGAESEREGSAGSDGRKPTGMRAGGRRSARTGPLSGTPGVRGRHRSHGAVAGLEVQAGARLITFERTANADENVGEDYRSRPEPALGTGDALFAMHRRVLGSLPDPLF
jgi:hypothetical protein